MLTDKQIDIKWVRRQYECVSPRKPCAVTDASGNHCNQESKFRRDADCWLCNDCHEGY